MFFASYSVNTYDVSYALYTRKLSIFTALLFYFMLIFQKTVSKFDFWTFLDFATTESLLYTDVLTSKLV